MASRKTGAVATFTHFFRQCLGGGSTPNIKQPRLDRPILRGNSIESIFVDVCCPNLRSFACKTEGSCPANSLPGTSDQSRFPGQPLCHRYHLSCFKFIGKGAR
jgi:hypothetical protein